MKTIWLLTLLGILARFVPLTAVVAAPAPGQGLDQPPAPVAPTHPEPDTAQANTPDPPAPDPNCEVQIPSDIAALVDGFPIERQEVRDKTQQALSQIQPYLLQSRQHQLELQINAVLLKQEAQRRGIDEATLLREEVVSKIEPPTQEQARAFHRTHQDRLQGDYETWKDRIIEHLTQQSRGEISKALADRLRAQTPVQRHTDSVDLTVTDADPTHVLAEVAGQAITLGDIDEQIRPTIDKINQKVYEFELAALDGIINTRLFREEARKRNLSDMDLYEQDIAPTIQPITEADAIAFYEKNKANLTENIDHPEDRARIVRYLQDQEEKRAKAAYADQLRHHAEIRVLISEPPRYVYDISVTDQPSIGNPDAPVVIVEFIDYQCPRCAALHDTLLKLRQEFASQVFLVARDFPLNQHPNAHRAALAAEAARAQGMYWEYATLMLLNQDSLDTDQLKTFADQLGLDRERFDRALDTEQFADRVRQDRDDGTRLGVSSTPTLFVNGQRVSDKSYTALKQFIERELSQASLTQNDAPPSPTP